MTDVAEPTPRWSGGGGAPGSTDPAPPAGPGEVAVGRRHTYSFHVKSVRVADKSVEVFRLAVKAQEYITARLLMPLHDTTTGLS